MCDTLINPNVHKAFAPKYTYKVCVKSPKGEYFTGVMGKPIKMGVWNQAPKHKPPRNYWLDFVNVLEQKCKPKSLRHVKILGGSSSFRDHHNGRWASFANYYNARASFTKVGENFWDTESNKPFKRVVLKCEIGGVIDEARLWGYKTFLSSSIKPICEI